MSAPGQEVSPVVFSKLSGGVQTDGTYTGRLSFRQREGEGEGCSQRVVPPGALEPLTLVLSFLAKGGEAKQTPWEPQTANTTVLP